MQKLSRKEVQKNDIIDFCLPIEKIGCMVLLLIIFAILLVLILLAGYVVFNMAYSPSKDRDVDYYKLPNNPQYEPYKAKSNKLTEDLVAIPYEEVWIESFDGLKLFGRYSRALSNALIVSRRNGNT